MINRRLYHGIHPRHNTWLAVAHAHENQAIPIISKVQVLILLKVRLLKFATDCPEMWLQLSIVEALHIQWDDFSRMVKAKGEIGLLAFHRILAHVDALGSFAKYGPHLFGLFKSEERSPYFRACTPPELRQLKMNLEKDPFNPPSAEAVVHAIAKHLATRAPEGYNDRYAVAAYRYHRLPNEFHDFDLRGYLLASRDSSMDAPPGLMQTKIYTPGRVVRKVIPPAFLQKLKLELSGKSPSKSRKPNR